MKRNTVESLEILQVYGIPIEYFREIDAACDAFFKRRKMSTERLSMKEQITNDRRLRHAKKVYGQKHHSQ